MPTFLTGLAPQWRSGDQVVDPGAQERRHAESWFSARGESNFVQVISSAETYTISVETFQVRARPRAEINDR